MDATVNARVTPIISGKSPQTDLAPGNALVAGMRLREFEIVETLGEGGFSIVYGARDLQLMREVAIKEYIPISLAGRVASTTVRIRSEHNRETFEAGLNGFINEARLLAQFKHPGLVEVLQFWEENGTAYMVMPRYTGKTLRSVLKEMGGRCDEPWLRGIVAPVLDVLELLHSRNVFHRDIAPDNILIKNDGTPVLLDLGSAREVVTGLQKAITVVVKPGYAPIEQYSSDFALPQGPWTDVYAVGALLHFAILGCPPPASISRIMKDSLQPLASAGHGGYSREFLTAIDRALALQPGDRPQSIAELRELLRVTKQDKTVIDLRPVFAAVAPPPPVPVPVVAAPEVTPLAELDPNLPGSEDERTVIVSAQEVAALVQQLAGAKAAAAAAAVVPATAASAAAAPGAAVPVAAAPLAAAPVAPMPDAASAVPATNPPPPTVVAMPGPPPFASAPAASAPMTSAAGANAQTSIGELPVIPPPQMPSAAPVVAPVMPAVAAAAADAAIAVESSAISHAAPIVAAAASASAATTAATPPAQEIETAASVPMAVTASDDARTFLSLSGVELTLEPMERIEPEADAAPVAAPAVAEWRIEAVATPPPRTAAASVADSEATLVMPAPAQLVEAARAAAAKPAAAAMNDATVVLPAPDALALARSVAAATPAPVAATANEPTVVLPAPVSLARPAPSPAELDPLAHAPKRETPASNSFPEMEELLSGRLATESRPVAVPVIRTPAKAEPAAVATPPPVVVRPWLLPVVGGGVLMILLAVLAAYLLSDEMPASAPPLVAETPAVQTPATPAVDAIAATPATPATIDPLATPATEQPAAATASTSDPNAAPVAGNDNSAPAANDPNAATAAAATTAAVDPAQVLAPVAAPSETTSASFEGPGQLLAPAAGAPAETAASSTQAATSAATPAAAAPTADTVKTVDLTAAASPRSEEAPARPRESASATRESAGSRTKKDTKVAMATSGNVKLSIQPWGEVWINGSLKGVSPPMRFLQLEPGTYNVELRNPGLQSLRRQLVVTAGQPAAIEHRFQPSGGATQ